MVNTGSWCFIMSYPLVNVDITMENHHSYNIIMGKLTINGHFLSLCKRLPEGNYGITVEGVRDQKKVFKASKKILPWGWKNEYLRHQKKKNLEPLVFYGPCNSLETKPSISVVFASFWKWSLSPVRFLQDIGPRNRAFAGLDAAVSTAPATLWSSNFWFSMVALKLTLV